jgi:ABC-type sugar transport system permease subunit
MAVPDLMMNESIDTGTEESVTEGIVSAMDFQALFANMAVGSGIVTTVATMVNNIYAIVNRSGVQMLIFLAALQSISPAIYESCKIDGATSWETFWKITLPMVSPMILVNGIYTLIDSFTMSDNKVMKFITSVYGDTSTGGGQEAATAMSWIYFLVIILLVAIIAGILSAFVFYQRKSE